MTKTQIQQTTVDTAVNAVIDFDNGRIDENEMWTILMDIDITPNTARQLTNDARRERLLEEWGWAGDV